MGIMNKITEGADLTHPKPTSGWLVGATIAVIVLLFVFAVASYLYRKGKSAVSGVTGTMNGSLNDSVDSLQTGWLS